MNSIITSIQKNGFHASKEILQNYSEKDWVNYVTVNPDYYHRTKVFSNKDFEIFVITWNINQHSKIHDHSENGCYMLLLQGELTEEIYKNIDITYPMSTTVIKQGFVGYIDNNIGYHKIKNASTTDVAISLHVYSPPNHKTKLLG